MKILFKDSDKIYLIQNEILTESFIKNILDIDLANIKHLDNIKPLYHYRDNDTNERYPVYYEYNGGFITKIMKHNRSGELNRYTVYDIYDDDIKDYTLVNLNLI